MKLNLLDLPDELLLEILSYHEQVKYDKFKNVRYLVNLSRVSRRFYKIAHQIYNNKFFLIYNFVSIYTNNILNKNHILFDKNILTNWSNLNVIFTFKYKYDLYLFNLYQKDLINYKNINISFNIENYIDEFIEFYNTKKLFFQNNKDNYTINISFYNELNYIITEKIDKVKDLFIYRNVSFNNCRNISIPNTIKTQKIKIYNCKNVTLNNNNNNNILLILNIKNSSAILINDILNVKLINIRCCYNIIFEKIENINQLKIIESRVFFNKKIININNLYIKMINNYFIIPSHSIIFKIIYLYKYYINIYTLDKIKDKYNIDYSNISIIDLHRSTKKYLY